MLLAAGSAAAAARRAGRRHDRRGDRAHGELFQSLAGEHSIVVVEHDMDFVRSIARKVTVLHEGACSPKARSTRCRATRASSKSIWDADSMLDDRAASTSLYGGSHILRDVSFNAARGQRHRAARAATASARRRCSSIMGLLPIRGRQRHASTDRTSRALARRSARARGIGYVPQGREIFPRLTVEENLRDRAGARGRRQAPIPEEIFDDVSGAEGDAAAARRRSLRRPAAAARHRPRAGHAAEAADPRRAHRRHPAVDHQGHRARHQALAGGRAWRSCWSSNTTTSPARSPTISGHGARRDRQARDGADMDRDEVRDLVG